MSGKLRRICGTLAALMLLLAVCPFSGSLAATSTTQVSADVEPVYNFTLPQGATISYGQTQTLLGRFGIGELLLYDGEVLTVELIAAPLTHTRDAAVTLPGTVEFAPPAQIDASNIGQAFDVRVLISREAYDSAPSGLYQGTLTFRVHSSRADGVIFSGTVLVAVEKPRPGRPPSGPKIPLGPGRPAIHITIRGGEHGQVLYLGEAIADDTTIPVTAGGAIALTITPDEGYAVENLLLDGQDISGKRGINGALTIRSIRQTHELEVWFGRFVMPPKTGDTGSLHAVLSVLIAICLFCRYRKAQKGASPGKR